MDPQRPTIDLNNPFYCPSIPATVYLDTLRRTLASVSRDSIYGDHPNSLFFVFAKTLERSGIIDGDTAGFVYDSENDWVVGVNLARRRRRNPLGDLNAMASNADAKNQTATTLKQLMSTAPKGTLLSEPAFTQTSPSMTATMDQFSLSDFPPNFQSTVVHRPAEFRCGAKRKRGQLASPANSNGTSEGDEEPAPKYAKSILHVDTSSFEVTVRHEKLDFNATGSQSQIRLGGEGIDFSYGASLASSPYSSTLSKLIAKLITLLPGIRLGERLGEISELDVQAVVDFLAEKGFINPAVLEVFQHTDIEELPLAASMMDEDGLNIAGEGLLEGIPSSPSQRPQTHSVQSSDDRIASITSQRSHSVAHGSTTLASGTSTTCPGFPPSISTTQGSATKLSTSWSHSSTR